MPPDPRVIPTDDKTFRASYLQMVKDANAGKDPWNQSGRGLVGYQHWFQNTFPQITPAAAEDLARGLLRVMLCR